MIWEVYEKAEDKDGVKDWAFYVVWKGEELNIKRRPIAFGYWFFGTEGGDPAGKRFYEEGRNIAQSEAERLTRLSKLPGR